MSGGRRRARDLSRAEFVALGAASAALLASCGPDLPEVEEGRPIVKEGELRPNSAFVYADADSGDPRVLVRLESGEFVLYDAKCSHRGCTVGYKPDEAMLECPCHGSQFYPENGAKFGGPADEPLRRLRVEARDGTVVEV